MGGFNAAFVRIAADADPEVFVEEMAEKFFEADRRVRYQCRVQYAQGYDWIYLCGFSGEGDSLLDTKINPALLPLRAETISLTAEGCSSSYYYRHHMMERCLRATFVSAGKVLQNFGFEEFWEKPRRENDLAEYGDEAGEWPETFRAGDNIEAFRLPSPGTMVSPQNGTWILAGKTGSAVSVSQC